MKSQLKLYIHKQHILITPSEHWHTLKLHTGAEHCIKQNTETLKQRAKSETENWKSYNALEHLNIIVKQKTETKYWSRKLKQNTNSKTETEHWNRTLKHCMHAETEHITVDWILCKSTICTIAIFILFKTLIHKMTMPSQCVVPQENLNEAIFRKHLKR